MSFTTAWNLSYESYNCNFIISQVKDLLKKNSKSLLRGFVSFPPISVTLDWLCLSVKSFARWLMKRDAGCGRSQGQFPPIGCFQIQADRVGFTATQKMSNPWHVHIWKKISDYFGTIIFNSFFAKSFNQEENSCYVFGVGGRIEISF